MLFRHLKPVLAFIACSCIPLTEARTAEVSFRNEVMAVLSKAGCNMGTCHGNKNGKGGFKLSLRGEDPQQDFLTLTREHSSRRVNPIEPDQSLLLRKPLMEVSHEGGRRFHHDSLEHQLLRRWIAAGLPQDFQQKPLLRALEVSSNDVVLRDPIDQLQLTVEATFSDGDVRDVTGLSVFEATEPIVKIDHDGLVHRVSMGETTVLVRYLDRQVPVRIAFIPDSLPEWRGPRPQTRIDELVFARLRRLQIQPSPLCSDEVFVRRAHLDLLGLLPTADEARSFVHSQDESKRAALVDDLLERPEFAQHWALKWSDLLRNEEKVLDRKGVQAFHAWIRRSIAVNEPVDQFVRALVASRGSTYTEPAANYWRAMRDPLMRAESTAQLFLGVRLQCARCHNHPFDRWTQDDYYRWANLFARIDYKIVENRRRDDNDKHEFDGEQIVFMQETGAVPDPRTGRPPSPRFLGDQGSEARAGSDPLLALAEWLTNESNESFARMQVNRIWHHFTGRGIVDPIDDFRATNPPANQQLLDYLTEEFVTSGFDRRQMIRLIMASHVYQAASEPNETNHADQRNFARVHIRRLPAETLFDAMTQVLDVEAHFNGYPAGLRAGQLPGVRAVRPRDDAPSAGDEFLKLFGKPPRLQSCECERSDETTLNQAFELTSGPLVNELLSRQGNRIDQWIAAAVDSHQICEELFWTALSRAPTMEESSAIVDYIQQLDDERAALEDVVWSVLSSSEFLFRH